MGVGPSPRRKRLRWFGECRASWCGRGVRPGWWRCPGLPSSCSEWFRVMPLVRKPKESVSVAQPALTALTSGNPDERWAAARAAAEMAGGAAALSSALRSENDPRVREAMFTSLARIGTPESPNGLLPLLRCDDAQLRA